MLTMPGGRVIIIYMKNEALPDFYDAARKIAEEAGVLCGRPIPISECRIIAPHKLDEPSFTPRSIMMLAAPYYTKAAAGGAQRIFGRSPHGERGLKFRRFEDRRFQRQAR